MSTSDEVTIKEFLKELMEVRFQAMEARFRAIEDKIDHLREAVVGEVKPLKDRVDALEDWKLSVEGERKAWRYVGGLVIAVVMALVVAWLRQWFGI